MDISPDVGTWLRSLFFFFFCYFWLESLKSVKKNLNLGRCNLSARNQMQPCLNHKQRRLNCIWHVIYSAPLHLLLHLSPQPSFDSHLLPLPLPLSRSLSRFHQTTWFRNFHSFRKASLDPSAQPTFNCFACSGLGLEKVNRIGFQTEIYYEGNPGSKEER